MNNGNTLVICAHPDDHILGVGGTIAKYSLEGKKVISIVCSYGEKSHLWLKEHIVKRIRKKESTEAAQIVGVYRELILGLKEGNLYDELNKEQQKKLIKRIIKQYRIKKIFTHSLDDPHPDHNAVVKFVLELTKNAKNIEVYSFNIWNPFNIRRTRAPRMYIDISDTISKKFEALKKFQSQKHVMMVMLGWLPHWLGAILAGLKSGTKYAEVFIKLK